MDLTKLTPGQYRAATTFGKPLMVAAGAGSGKTFTLANRIVYALLPESGGGAPLADTIEQICAITFTNAAAAELKARVKATLRAEGLIDQALRVDDAWISTIHGMCMRILKANALLLGIDPDFDILVDNAYRELYNRVLDGVLRLGKAAEDPQEGDALAPDNEDIALLIGEFGATELANLLIMFMDQVRGTARKWDAISVLNAMTDPLIYANCLRDVYARMVELASSTREAGVAKHAEPAAACLDELNTMIDEMADCETRTACDLMADFLGRTYRPSKPGKVSKPDAVAMKELISALQVELHRFALGLRILMGEPFATPLIRATQLTIESFAEAKRENRVMDNQDLILETLGAFERQPEVLKRYRNRFRLVMVDEFQDTNQLQLDLISHLCGEGRERLCTVGDVQQSIYGFQGANVAVMRNLREDILGKLGGEVPALDTNFRSHGDVLAFVKKVFSGDAAFGEEFLDLKPNPNRPNAWTSVGSGGEPRIMLLAGNTRRKNGDVPGISIADIRAAEARMIAEEFARLHVLGVPQKDMVILLGVTTNARIYADALQAVGLDAVITGGSVLGRVPEVQMLVSLARVLRNPHDDEALYRVLSGDMFCVPDGELLELATYLMGDSGEKRVFRRKLSRGFDDLLVHPDAGTGMPFAVHAARVLRRGLDGIGEGTLDSLLEKMVVESGWIARLMDSGSTGISAVANILKTLRIARGFCKGTGFGFVEACEEFCAFMDANPKEAPGALSGAGGEYVRLMTIHASKGLEYPVVAVTEYESNRHDGDARACVAARTPQGGYADVLLAGTSWNGVAEDEGGKPLKAGGEALGTLGGFKGVLPEEDFADDAASCLVHMAAKTEEDAEAERLRLLYVAITRAREALILTLRSDNGKGKPLASRIADALFEDGLPAEDCLVDYGGESPASYKYVEAIPGEAALDTGIDGDDARDRCIPDGAVYRAPRVFEPDCAPYSAGAASLREKVFSYSGISHAADHGPVEDEVKAADPKGPSTAKQPMPAPIPDEDEGDQPLRSAEDEDKATSFGSAFHLCAQWAIETGSAPDEERIRTIVAAQQVSEGEGQKDLPALLSALRAWFGGSAYTWAKSQGYVRAEAPFVVGIEDAYLEGSIDLLCADSPIGLGTRAVLFDYKTGGHDDETPQARYYKHLLQAQCYAYALLKQGCVSVDAHFVRVQRTPLPGFEPYPGTYAGTTVFSDVDTVDYRFTAADLMDLEMIIADTYRRHRVLV